MTDYYGGDWMDGEDANVERRNNAVVFFEDKQQFELLSSLTSNNKVNLTTEQGGLNDALKFTEKDHKHDLWLIDCRKTKTFEQLIEKLSQLKPRLNRDALIMIVAKVEKVQEYKQLLKLGVSEVLSAELNKDEIVNALKMHMNLSQRTETFLGKGIAFWGARGGVGTTTLATNVAHYVANNLHRHLLYVDLDCFYGDSGILFDTEDKGLLTDVLDVDERLDWLLLDRAVIKLSEKRHLLNDELPVTQPYEIKQSALNSLAILVAQRYATHVWDLPAHFNYAAMEAVICRVQVCVLVVEPTLSSLRDLQRKLEFLQKYDHVRPVVVLNQSRSNAKSRLDPEVFEKSVGMPIDLVIPYAGSAAIVANEQGGFLIDGKHRTAKKMQELAQECLGNSRKRGLLSMLKWRSA